MFEYDSRDLRHRFIADKFGEYITGSVINIGGGGEKHFLNYIDPKEYLEVDIAGKPDIKVDLDKEFPLPIDDDRCDAIICTDVLEHLDEFHRVFKELLRISRKYVIISVPNALMEFKSYFKHKKYQGDAGEAGIDVGYYTKFYGLPKIKPQDRHRWFFSYTEARDFFNSNAKELGYKVIKECPIGEKGSSIKGKFARAFVKRFFGEELMKDLFYSVYWCVLERDSGD